MTSRFISNEKTRYLSGILCLFWWALIAVYWISVSDPFHLLWMCDLTLLITGIGIVIKSPALLSSQIVGTLPIQIAWNIDFWLRLISGTKIFGFTDYMFSPAHPAEVKVLSLFHIFLPVILVFSLIRFGYNANGWKLQALITAAAYLVSYVTTNPSADANWVLGPFWREQKILPGWLWLIIWLLLTVLMYWMFNLILKRILRLNKKNQ